jgi:hypothetical protein
VVTLEVNEVLLAVVVVVANIASIPAVVLHHRHVCRTWATLLEAGHQNGRRALAAAALRASRFRLAFVAGATVQTFLLVYVLVLMARPARLSGAGEAFVVVTAAMHVVAAVDCVLAYHERRRILRSHGFPPR